MRKLLIIIAPFIFIIHVYGQSEIEVSSKRNDDHSVEFTYKKIPYGTFYLVIDFNRLDNADFFDDGFNVSHNQGSLFKLKPKLADQSISYSYSYSYIRGRLTTKVDDSFGYLLPFKNGVTVQCNYMSSLNHEYFDQKKAENFIAFSFRCQKPESVCAIRRGLVVEVVDEFFPDTTKAYSYSSKSNSVMIEHPDGTLATYTGFAKGQISVKEGDEVYPGQLIGLLGRYDNDKHYQLRLSVIHLIRKDFKNDSGKGISDMKPNYRYVNPVFYTNSGEQLLDSGEDYTCVVEEEQIFKELKKREIKKYLKGDPL